MTRQNISIGVQTASTRFSTMVVYANEIACASADSPIPSYKYSTIQVSTWVLRVLVVSDDES